MKILPHRHYANCVRISNPAFTGRVSVFSKKMDKMLKSSVISYSENNNLLNILRKVLTKKIKTGTVLGEGNRGIVLGLDSKYVLKIDKNSPLKLDVMSVPFNKFSDLSFKSYLGGVVAKFGNVSILKNVSKTGKHLPAGVPTSFVESNCPKECVEYYEKKYLPRFASLPQKSFDDVAYDFKLLNKSSGEGHYFDVSNPNNFVLVGRKIKIVDSICKSFEKEMTTSDMLSPLLFLQDVSNECSYSSTALNNRRKLFKKIILAGIKNDLPLMNEDCSYVFEVVLEELCKSKVDTNRFNKDVSLLKSKFSNKKELLSHAKQYLNSIFDAQNDDLIWGFKN